MSHFTRIKTRIVERDYLLKALKSMGYRYEEGDVAIRGYGGRRARVEIKVPTGSHGYEIGFHKSGDSYEVVADWWGIRQIHRDEFLRQLSQRYAYQVARAKLEDQGFELVSEEVEQKGRIHLTLRRMA